MWPHQGVITFTMMAAIPPIIAAFRRDGRAFLVSLVMGVLVCWLARYSYFVPIAIVLIIASFGLVSRGLNPRLPLPSGDWAVWIRTAIFYLLFLVIAGCALNLSVTYNWTPPRLLAEPLASPLTDRDEPMTEALNARFPVGTAEAVLRRSLLNDGFAEVVQPHPFCMQPQTQPTTYRPCPAGTREMTYVYTQFSLVCGSTRISVTWSIDPSGKLAALQATGYTPCF